LAGLLVQGLLVVHTGELFQCHPLLLSVAQLDQALAILLCGSGAGKRFYPPPLSRIRGYQVCSSQGRDQPTRVR
jgi:hypothetical protein